MKSELFKRNLFMFCCDLFLNLRERDLLIGFIFIWIFFLLVLEVLIVNYVGLLGWILVFLILGLVIFILEVLDLGEIVILNGFLGVCFFLYLMLILWLFDKLK